MLCTSVNDAVLHGLPHDYTLQDGDLLSVDFAASVDGWVSDSAYSLVVGTPRQEDLELIDVASRALDAGDRRGPGRQPARRHLARHRRRGPRRPGSPSTSSSAATASAGPCTATRTSPNDGRPHRGLKLKEGLVIAIEPWFLHTTNEIYTDPDGWTLRSADGSRGAHMEHTVAITGGGPVVLTARD